MVWCLLNINWFTLSKHNNPCIIFQYIIYHLTNSELNSTSLWYRTFTALFLIINLFILFIYFWLRLGLQCCMRAFSSCGERGPLFLAVHVLLIAVASLVAERGLSACRLSSCGIFLDQGSNPCLLHWQADSQPLHHQGSPSQHFYTFLFFTFLSGTGSYWLTSGNFSRAYFTLL